MLLLIGACSEGFQGVDGMDDEGLAVLLYEAACAGLIMPVAGSDGSEAVPRRLSHMKGVVLVPPLAQLALDKLSRQVRF